ncbi:MAG: hypothetical protein M1814_006465 [Vezdaea aestivalis]|nr:MAG: hypothetical protein M1814_006465 [Vezdaea aestivalis]
MARTPGAPTSISNMISILCFLVLFPSLTSALPTSSPAPPNLLRRDNVRETCSPRHIYYREVYNGLAETLDRWGPAYLEADFLAACRLKKGQNVLELASGLGTLAISAKKIVGASGKVVAIDISDKAIAKSRQAASQQRLQINFRVANLNAIEPVLHRIRLKYDAIICASSFQFVENPTVALKAWAQFLKPGGRIVFDVQPRHLQGDLGAIDIAAKQLGFPPVIGPGAASAFDAAQDIKGYIVAAGLEAQVERGKTLQGQKYSREVGIEFIRQTMENDLYKCYDTTRLEARSIEWFNKIYDRNKHSDGFVHLEVFFWNAFAIKPA